MCGIAGIVTDRIEPQVVMRRAAAMSQEQSHRGPDDCGLELLSRSDPVAAFSHRRLAVIDISPAGHQPMTDPESGACVVFNGEIYNYRELRADLERCGHGFTTDTDTEVLLKAHARWGRACVTRLRGMFAFGMWDPRDRSLLLARDHLGVKPLYYCVGNGSLAFASEVRALLTSELTSRRIDAAGLWSFMSFGSVQDPQTVIEGIQSLLPGHTLLFREGRADIDRYWRLPTTTRDVGRTSDLYEAVAERLSDATRSQIVSDVPIGAFLSGGIDSTAVVALMSRASPLPVRTSSIVFDELDYDEREYSRLAAKRLGTEHTELLLSGEDVRRGLDDAMLSFDQPSVDGLNTYFVSKVTKEAGLSVALSGLGGDELFGGYGGYHRALQADIWSSRISSIPTPVRRFLGGAVHSVAGRERTRRLADLIEGTRVPYFLTRQLFGRRQIRALLTPEFESFANSDPPTFERIESESSGLDPINRASAFEMQTYMVSTLLRDTDQMSMAHALEVRVPLLDHKLVEFVFQIPGALKIDDRYPKPLLVKSLGDAIPKECVFRPKRGFELPFARWLSSDLEEEMKNNFFDRDSSPFQSGALEQVWTMFAEGRLSWSRVWGVFALLTWLRTHRITL